MLRVITFPISLLSIIFIDFYRLCLSPLFGNGCCYLPSCSYFAKKVFIKFNFFSAIYLTTNRLFRCNPKNSGGIDFFSLNIKGDYKWVC